MTCLYTLRAPYSPCVFGSQRLTATCHSGSGFLRGMATSSIRQLPDRPCWWAAISARRLDWSPLLPPRDEHPLQDCHAPRQDDFVQGPRRGPLSQIPRRTRRCASRATPATGAGFHQRPRTPSTPRRTPPRRENGLLSFPAFRHSRCNTPMPTRPGRQDIRSAR